MDLSRARMRLCGNAYFDFNDVPVAAIGQDVCGKRLRSCELRFAQQRFAGSVTLGSNIITMDQPVSFSTGDPVSGFGLPAGTTVSSVAGRLVTVSQDATASSSTVTTGTIQSNLNQIIVTSATGLAAGMTVTGAYLPANTQVVGVSGNTVTLSSTVDATQFLVVATTFASMVNPFALLRPNTNNAIFIFPTSNPTLTVGQYISSSLVPLSKRARIVELRFSLYRFVIINQSFDQSPLAIQFATWTVYNVGTIPSATYTFTVTNPNYTFRADASIPYGSYPGIGAFFT